jgi:hypothetical protein
MRYVESDFPQLERGGLSAATDALTNGVSVSVWDDTDPRVMRDVSDLINAALRQVDAHLGLPRDEGRGRYGQLVGRVVAAQLAQSPGFTVRYGDRLHPAIVQNVDLGSGLPHTVNAPVETNTREGGQ